MTFEELCKETGVKNNDMENLIYQCADPGEIKDEIAKKYGIVIKGSDMIILLETTPIRKIKIL